MPSVMDAPELDNELPRSKLRGIKPPFAYTKGPPVWRGETRVACEP
jgi:hypothetical protein